ncbi:hypothetical protein Tco_0015544 [Tanacetum coccineum]
MMRLWLPVAVKLASKYNTEYILYLLCLRRRDLKVRIYTMADVNANAHAEQAPAMAPPTRTDDQILPHSRWVPVGKSNYYLDVEKSQSNTIYKITVDILKHTNFFRAFIASSTIPSIYIQQFWDIVRYDKITGNYSCQLDEQWFDLTKDTLRDALQITPVDNNAFSSPPTPDVLIKFVNDLGYPKVFRTLSDVVTNDMFQPWRALTTIINLCLTGKTSGFERPRARVLQILWGVVYQAHIDYAERMWEEFTQSIHTFIEYKKNLARHTHGKKKANLIVIPSVRFTKLIIHHLQSKHKFHLRPCSPLHLPNEESVLGYLKFSAKGTKREVFGMPIPNDLITTDIRGEQYYNAYLEKVAKHKRYLASEEVSDPDSPAPKPAKATKPKATKQAKPLAPKAAPVTKPAAAKAPKPTTSQPPKPTSATTEPSKKDLSKKRKLVKESSEAPSPEKRLKVGKVIKKRTQKSSRQLVDEFVDEGVPVNEPRFSDEEADMQKAVEESLKDVYATHQGLLPLVVIRKPESRKFQSLLEVQGKGKEKRRTLTATEPSGHEESSSLYAELGLTDSETESDDDVSPEINPEAQDEGQAGPNPGKQVEGQAGSNPGDDAYSQPQPSPVVHAGPNLEHMDFEAIDAPTQQIPEQMDEGFIATAYPNVQENLKLTVEEQVILEEPASSTGTLSSLQHLTKDFSFGDQFFNDKPSEGENEKTTAETEAESMVSVTIHQDTSAIHFMTSSVIDLIPRPDSFNEHRSLPATATVTAITITTITTLPLPPQPQQGYSDSILIHRIGELEQHMVDLVQANLALKERMDKHESRLYKLENLDIPHQVSKAVDETVIDVVDWAIQDPLRDRFRDLPEVDMKEILHHRMWESNSYKAHEDHKKLYEALEKSMDRDHTDQLLIDLAEARRKKKRRQDSPKTPPGSPPHQPPPPPLPASPSRTSRASGLSQLPPPPPPLSTNQTWRTTDTRLKPSVLSIPEDLHMDDDVDLDEQVHSSNDEDIGNDHIPKVNLKQDWWKPLSEDDRPSTPEPVWSIPSSDIPVPMNNWASTLASTYAPPPENSLLAQTGDMAIFMDWFCKQQGITELKQTDLYNVSKPLPLGGPPGQVTIQTDFFFNKDLKYLRYGRKGGRPALSISKMKAAYYPDVGLEQMVPDQMWIEEECKYDIAAIAVRTHMRILSVVRIEVFSLYGYDYMKKIVLRRADLKEHIIAERDFKYLYPSDFEDLCLLNLQGHLNHLRPNDKKILTTAVNLWTRNLVIRQRVEDFQLGIESYQTQLNLTKPRWDATGFEFKQDFTVIDSPRAVTFWDKYGVQMIMRFNEIHKFSDGTLHQIDEALDYRVKEFKDGKVRYSFPRSHQSRRDLPKDNPLVSVAVLRWQSAPASAHYPGEQDEGQAGPNPGDVAASQPPPSHVVLAGPDLKHMNLEASNTLIQPNPKQMDDEFTTTAYPNVQENLKLPTEGEVRLEDPFLAEKSHEDEPEKTNIEAEVQSMVTVPIHQDTSSVPLMTTLVIDLTAIQPPIGDHFRDLPEADMKEILHYRMWESNSYQDHEDHKMIYEALEKSMAHDQTDKLLTDLAKARKKKKKRRDLPKTPLGSPPHQPPHPLPPASSSGTPKLLELLDSTDARSSSKTAASAEYTAWTTTDTRLKPSVLLIPEELHMDDATTHDEQVQSSGDEDIGHDHIPTASALASTYAPPTENSLLVQTGDMAIFIDWFCKKQGSRTYTTNLEGPAYEIVKVFHPNVIHLQYQIEECHKLLIDQVDESIIRYNVSKPLPLGGPPGQVTIQSEFFFNKDLEYLMIRSTPQPNSGRHGIVHLADEGGLLS